MNSVSSDSLAQRAGVPSKQSAIQIDAISSSLSKSRLSDDGAGAGSSGTGKVEVDCSLLIVAHRLATIKACDRIYVMESGTVVEEGTHAELVERGGVYAGMVERQSFGD